MSLELHRNRRSLALGVLVALAGLVGLFCAWNAANTLSTVFYAIFGGLAVLLGAGLVREEFRPFRFGVGAEGLTLTGGTVPWPEVVSVALDEPVSGPGGPYVRLVTTDGDERVVLKLDDVRESRAEVAEVLERHGGARFTDAPRERRTRLALPDFRIVLRGYERGHVDALLRRAGDALLPGGEHDRPAVRASIDEARLPVAGRGYDREQVDRALRAITVKLLGEP
ncbi:hypothetical protein GCM10010399_54100 [Dactylosporangium fulvum]|uniref:DivIVA domain-containing protein n=1 Tax=Dactylosporangium fulvum TaxID=53359 RepID=A0ABY5WAZ5_9ACTN|nr:hypothetical protein [Dactylosporangium fulvum]UWP87228.1 hypothetical protein Dfulv_24485 [Dactylosporangium fulvum]